MTWGTGLTLLGALVMTSRNELVAISGLPIAVVGIVVVWPAVKYRKRIAESVPEPQRTTNRKKFGIRTIIGAVGMALLFLVLSPDVPHEHLSAYLFGVVGMVSVSIVVGLAMWKPWQS
jgi:hypothetical protein